jgi:prepilin-type N-terminal cleavage/methylation domain-containing protein
MVTLAMDASPTRLSRLLAASHDGDSSRWGDDGLTLIELLVTMLIMLAVMGAFLIMFVSLNSSATSTTALSQSQGQVRNIMRILEADLRSSDPLLLVPASFTSGGYDPGAITSPGAQGISPTDVVALYSIYDSYSPCRTSQSPNPPSPYQPQTYTPNVIWALNATNKTLTRYSLCNAIWTPDEVLRNVTTPRAGTGSGATGMFTVAQDFTSTGSTLNQQPLPANSTQSTPVCGTSITISIEVTGVKRGTPFRVRAVITLTNQPAASPFGCVGGRT